MTGRLAVIMLLSALCALAQPYRHSESRRAEMRGDDHPKCRIEVVVDNAAEVVIHGDSAELHTIAGQDAQWRRFICSEVLPMNPIGFRFIGIDGRGRQTLVREPGRGGPAVIRIEDPKGGREGYTFDIEWRGDAGGGNRERREEGPRGPGEWTGRQGGEFQYRGDGRGFFNRRSGQDMPVRDVVVSLRRDGDVAVDFEAPGLRRLVFRGKATRIAQGVVEAELTSTGGDRDTRGSTVIYMNGGGQVDRVTMRGQVGGDPFKLDWSAR